VPELILGDSMRIRQIVANLVANAIKFTPTGGVHIHLGLDGEAPGDAAGSHRGMRVRIQIADSGVGIDPARLPFLFKPFHQPTRASAAALAAPAWACRSPTTWRS
jgi:signal transduction histidine kinase